MVASMIPNLESSVTRSREIPVPMRSWAVSAPPNAFFVGPS